MFKRKSKKDPEAEPIQTIAIERVLEIFKKPKSAKKEEIRSMAFVAMEALNIIGSAMEQAIANTEKDPEEDDEPKTLH